MGAVMSEEDAFWEAVGANPSDSLVRGVFADWLDDRGEPGDGDTAAGLRATCTRVPAVGWLNGKPYAAWFRSYLLDDEPAESERIEYHLTKPLFDALTDGTPDGTQWRDYPSARAAVADLVRAWVKTNCTNPCELCLGSGGDRTAPQDGRRYACEQCMAVSDLASGSGVRCPHCQSDRMRKWRQRACPACRGSGVSPVSPVGA